MPSYGQYCPISRASEILGERWTLLLVRNLLLGAKTFNDIAGGVPGMSRSLLSSRLRGLEQAGLIHIHPRADRRGKVYELTDAGRSLWDVIGPLAQWGRRFLELKPEHTDPSFVLWAWVHVHLRRERLPKRRVVVQFDFPEQPPHYRRFWFLIERGEAELCYVRPGYDEDLRVTAKNEPFTRWHVGELAWRDALRAGDIRVDGPGPLARALPTWNERAA
ncbi:MAG: helix-turn-helix transcriptional regulator [Polyangiaceae bacterium]|nr:helix-turn-helix transcriptional regulator [Polyangiaceae bacterium]